MITGNKGEWSEIYVLFKLLGDKNIFVGDANYNKIENLIYPIIKIIRTESGINYEFEIDGELVLVSGGVEKFKLSIQTFQEQAVILLSKIKEAKGVFNAPEIEEFMKSINCSKLKPSTTKADIRIVIYDHKINQTAELGFSIKSKLGGESTLLNAGNTTNFIYKIAGFSGTVHDIERINQIESRSKIKERLDEIKKLGGELEFISPEKDIFKNNLVLIDSLLPNLLAELLKQYYTSNLSRTKELTEEISRINPLSFDTQHSHSFYEYKVKRFLTDIALGMMPSKVWGGIYDATGGYLIVKENGDVLCYHIYNRNQFEDYLFNNTKIETASSTRHNFAQIYQQENDLFFKLNLQIRFI